MLNLDNPNFERPSAILRENSRFLVEQNRFTGPKSYDGGAVSVRRLILCPSGQGGSSAVWAAGTNSMLTGRPNHV